MSLKVEFNIKAVCTPQTNVAILIYYLSIISELFLNSGHVLIKYGKYLKYFKLYLSLNWKLMKFPQKCRHNEGSILEAHISEFRYYKAHNYWSLHACRLLTKWLRRLNMVVQVQMLIIEVNLTVTYVHTHGLISTHSGIPRPTLLGFKFLIRGSKY